MIEERRGKEEEEERERGREGGKEGKVERGREGGREERGKEGRGQIYVYFGKSRKLRCRMCNGVKVRLFGFYPKNGRTLQLPSRAKKTRYIEFSQAIEH